MALQKYEIEIASVLLSRVRSASRSFSGEERRYISKPSPARQAARTCPTPGRRARGLLALSTRDPLTGARALGFERLAEEMRDVSL